MGTLTGLFRIAALEPLSFEGSLTNGPNNKRHPLSHSANGKKTGRMFNASPSFSPPRLGIWTQEAR